MSNCGKTAIAIFKAFIYNKSSSLFRLCVGVEAVTGLPFFKGVEYEQHCISGPWGHQPDRGEEDGGEEDVTNRPVSKCNKGDVQMTSPHFICLIAFWMFSLSSFLNFFRTSGFSSFETPILILVKFSVPNSLIIDSMPL